MTTIGFRDLSRSQLQSVYCRKSDENRIDYTLSKAIADEEIDRWGSPEDHLRIATCTEIVGISTYVLLREE